MKVFQSAKEALPINDVAATHYIDLDLSIQDRVGSMRFLKSDWLRELPEILAPLSSRVRRI